MPHSVGRTVILHKDDFAYNSHPSIAVLDNGEWLAVFGSSRRREPKQHPPGDPLFRNLLVRTADRGATWSEPAFVPDFDWYGVECPGIAQLANGTVVLTQFRFGWYPLGLARQRRAAGEPIYLSLPGREHGGWTEESPTPTGSARSAPGRAATTGSTPISARTAAIPSTR